MGCGALLDLTWGFQSESFVKEVANHSPPSQFQDTVRATPGKWSATLISEALGLNFSGEGLLPRSENLTKPYFAGEIDAKEGWRLTQCSDPEFLPVLSFLLPILSPQKPKRVTVRVGSTILAAYTGLRVISWPKILEDVIGLQARSLHLKTPTSLSYYLVHLYAHQKVLLEEMESFESLSYLALVGDLDDVVEDVPSDLESDGEEVPLARPLSKRKLSQSFGPGRDSGPGGDVGPGRHPDMTTVLDPALRPGSSTTSAWLPSMELRMVDIWLCNARAKVDNMEDMLAMVASKLDCSAPEIMSTLDETLGGASKGRIVELEAEQRKDQARISHLRDSIAELGPFMPGSAFEEDEDVDDQAPEGPPMEPASSIVISRPSSPPPIPVVVSAPTSPKAPTIDELSRMVQQAIPDGEPPSCPFVTTTSGPIFMAIPLASSS
ncbi:unnamed protein product [Calypogeia fissa]